VNVTARAHADLARGEVGTYAEATRPPTDSGFGTGRAQPWASLADTVIFTNSNSGAVSLELRYTLSGTVSVSDGLGWTTQAGIHTKLTIQAAGDSNQVLFDSNGQPASYTADGFFNQDGLLYFSPGNLGFGAIGEFVTEPIPSGIGAVIRTTLSIPSGQSLLGIRADLDLDCLSANVCDFGRTGQVRFGDLPSGLSYSSASGVFLSAVPLPPTLWMMLAGLGVIGGVGRRRQCH
jgi:hypothetical protein